MALCFGLTFLIYVSLVPRFLNYASPPTGDQPFYLMDTISLVQDGDLELSNNYAEHDEDKFYGLAPHGSGFFGMSAPYPLPPQTTQATGRPPEEMYASHLPGLSVWLVPAWVIGSWFSLWWPATIVFMCLLGALAAVNVFLLAHELTGKLWIALAVWPAIAFSNPIMSYSYLIFTEMPAGLLLIYAFRRLALGWGAIGWGRWLLVGACIAYIPWLAWRCVPIAGLLAVYALIQWWRYAKVEGLARAGDGGQASDEDNSGNTPYASGGNVGEGGRERERAVGFGFRHVLSLVWMFVPIVISAALVVVYCLVIFGTILPPGGGSLVQGQPAIFHWPWAGGEELTRFVTDAFGLLFDRQMGLLPYAPVYVFSAVGLIAMLRSGRRSDRRLVLWLALMVLPYMTVIAAFDWWNGVWCAPARYFTTFVPLAAAPLAVSLGMLARSRIYRIMYALLALIGVVVMAGLMVDARRLFPIEREIMFRWLNDRQSPVRLNIWEMLPYFTPPNDMTHPLTTGWLTIASLMIVLGGYLLLLSKDRKVERRAAWRPAAHGLIWLGAVCSVGAGWLTMNYEYLKAKTILTQQVRWNLQPEPLGPKGIEYLDGKIYVTAYDNPAVGVLDTSIQSNTSYNLTQPFIDGSGPVAYVRPGDIRVGPDKLLYVLNNGPGEQAMYVIKPDGELMRHMPLNGLSDIAIGLQFGPDGAMYVADLRGGRVRKYPVTGGNPIAEWGGMTGSFNNVVGIAVDDYGTIYAAESSNHRIQQLDPKGAFVRAFDLPCGPSYIAINGDWLDTTCGEEVISINKKTGGIQHSRVENGPEMRSPTGLVYGPDGTLYVSDGGAVIAYKVQH